MTERMPAGWLPVHRDELWAQRSVTSIGELYFFIVMASYCESSPGSFDECRLSAGWPPTLRPSQPTWTVSLPEKAATTIAISPKADTHLTFQRRVEG